MCLPPFFINEMDITGSWATYQIDTVSNHTDTVTKLVGFERGEGFL
jgi:hypothetical protein